NARADALRPHGNREETSTSPPPRSGAGPFNASSWCCARWRLPSLPVAVRHHPPGVVRPLPNELPATSFDILRLRLLVVRVEFSRDADGRGQVAEQCLVLANSGDQAGQVFR